MKQINLDALSERAYNIACAHGFHDSELSDSHFFCLVISELCEAVEADRKGKHADMESFKDSLSGKHMCSDESWFKVLFDELIKDTVEDELADSVIRLLDLAGLRKIKLSIYGKLGTANLYKMSFTEAIQNIIGEIYKESWGGYYAEKDQLKNIIEMMLEKIHSLSRGLEIDLLESIEKKMQYNELREKMHGKKY